MRASDFAIENPVFAWMLMAGLIVFGAVGFSRMGLSQLPDAEFPVVTVTITDIGAAPEVMEAAVADPLEDQLMQIQGLRTLTTTSTLGRLTAVVELDLNRNIDAAVQDVETAVMAAQKRFPPQVDPARITKTNPDDQPIIWVILEGQGKSQRELMTYVNDYVKDQFAMINGVGDVITGGYTDPAMRIWVNPHQLRRHNIALTDVINTVKEENVEIPGGDFDTRNKNLNLRVLGEAVTPADFGNMVINGRAGAFNQETESVVRLHDVARVEGGLMEVTRMSRFNGIPCVGLGIVKQKGSNAIGVANAVKAKIAELTPILKPGFKLGTNFDTTRFINDAVHELTMNLVMSAILTALCCWVFLGSLSATFNVVLSIPTSIMGAFIVLYFMGFTLNTFTLLGLSLAIGIVVDDAIMVLENIVRHNEEGRPRMQAAIVGAREITFAAMAATIAIVAIFLPVAFMTGIIGKFFFQFGVTISATVLISLFEALTITPMRCSRFVDVHKRTDFFGRKFEAGMVWLRDKYASTLAVVLDYPWITIGIAFTFMFISYLSAYSLKKEFTPPQDQSIFLIRVKTATDFSLAHTNDDIKKLEQLLLSSPQVRQIYSSVGGTSTTGVNLGSIFVTMKDIDDRPVDPYFGHRPTQQEYMREVREQLSKVDPEMHIFAQDLSTKGFTATRGFPIEFTIRGDDWPTLWKLASGLMKSMNDKSLATDIDTDYLLGKPELDMTPDRVKAAAHGVTIQDIGTTVGAMMGGVRLNQYTENAHRYYSMVQVDPAFSSTDTLSELYIRNAQNNLTPLSDTVSAVVNPAMQQITRIDRQHAITIFANPSAAHSQQEAMDFIQAEAKSFPAGYSLALMGSSQMFAESFRSLIFALILGIFVAYMVLSSQFNSFFDPISVLVALPFSVSGAFIALLITHQSLNIYSMIGLILLMGIVKKNSILLVEFANVARDKGERDVGKALREACPVRLRPIVMTSFACIAAAVPEAVSFGAGSETTRPMACSIIGGVLVSTLLTLYVVPCVYQLFARIQNRHENLDEIRQAFADVGNEGLRS